LGRDYTNQSYPSVTEITDTLLPSEWKQYWFANSVADAACEAVPPLTRAGLLKAATKKRNEVSSIATGVGGRIHKAIEQYLVERSFEGACEGLKNEAEVALFSKFTNQLSDRSIEAHRVEQKLESDELRLNGTPDFIGNEDGRLVLFDWKTSKKMDKLSYSYQMGGYALLWKHVEHSQLHHAEVLRVGKDGVVGKPLIIENLEEWAQRFKRLREVYYDIMGA
jgi:hypothetical protein